MSFRGICTECSTAAVADSIRQMNARKGPRYEKWLRACLGPDAPPEMRP